MKNVVAVIDEDGNEALYVSGVLHKIEGNTIYACDIAEVLGDEIMQFSQVHIEGNKCDEWPERFDSLEDVKKDEPMFGKSRHRPTHGRGRA